MDMQEIADKLKAAGIVSVLKSDVHDDIENMAKSIYKCPYRNRSNRTYDQVFNDCSKIVAEFVLAKVLNGQRNPNEWDCAVKESYSYDVQVDDIRFELKRHQLGTRYFSYRLEDMKTFLKHAANVDYLVTAYVENKEDHYDVEFGLIAKGPSFGQYFVKSNYENKPHYYNHNRAVCFGECVAFGLREPIHNEGTAK